MSSSLFKNAIYKLCTSNRLPAYEYCELVLEIFETI